MIKVLIAATSSIMGEAIEQFLNCEEDLRVKLILLPPYVDLKLEIDRLRPDVVLIEDDVLAHFKLNTEARSLDLSRIHLITVSMYKNEVEIDQSYWVPIKGLTDLLPLIRGSGGF
jgi:chemotaxis response regulator CheB